jgi:hypothetical protein
LPGTGLRYILITMIAMFAGSPEQGDPSDVQAADARLFHIKHIE